MSFFQNPFASEFRGNLVLGDRQYSPGFIVPSNAGRGDEIVSSWINGPFNLTGNDGDGNAKKHLTIKFSADSNFSYWGTLVVDLTTSVASSTAAQVYEIVNSLNADSVFPGYFTAQLDSTGTKVQIKQNLPATRVRFFVVNTGAETLLRFNARAGVAAIPSYFARHIVGGIQTYPDSTNNLILLNPGGSTVDSNVITNATDAKGNSLGLTTTVLADYQLLRGKSGIFVTQKMTIDGSDRITQIIEYSSGALAGDLGRKIVYSYTSSNTNPDYAQETPYTLQSGDIM